VGCGAGRMTRSFATRFSRVLALDISPEMKMRGESYLAEFSNIEWVLGNGADLAPVDSQSVGFVFSYLVLQHLPTKTLAFHYMTEMMRTLEPGGFFLLQYNDEKLSAMNLKGRLVWGVVDGLWLAGLRRASQFIASLLGLDPKLAGKSWRGAALDAAEVSQTLRAAGASTIHTKGGSTPLAWAWGTKSKP
jgi:ubiquinone/menaquinone biosynthesis C-methylase UbiE